MTSTIKVDSLITSVQKIVSINTLGQFLKKDTEESAMNLLELVKTYY